MEQEEGIWTRPMWRECNNPAPKFGGDFCLATDDISNVSSIICEPINGNWSDFGNWSSCYMEDEKWNQKADRNCSNPLPKYGGKCLQDDFGGSTITKECLPGLN